MEQGAIHGIHVVLSLISPIFHTNYNFNLFAAAPYGRYRQAELLVITRAEPSALARTRLA